MLSTRHVAPRDYTRGAPRPNREAVIAARRAFVALKLAFAEAAAAAEGTHSHWLREQVRAAEDPVDLWLLRASLFSELASPAPEHRELRRRVRRALQAVFAEPQPSTTFGTP